MAGSSWLCLFCLHIGVQAFGQKVAFSAISLLFSEDQKCIEILYIYEIERRGLHGFSIF